MPLTWLLFCNQYLVRRLGHEPCQHGRAGILVNCHGKSWQQHPFNLDLCPAVRQPLRISRRKVDHPSDDCDRLMGHAPNPKPAYLDQPGEFLRSARDEPAVTGLEPDTVV